MTGQEKLGFYKGVLEARRAPKRPSYSTRQRY